MRRIFLVYVAGMLTIVALLVHLGGEAVTQLGLRLSAAEQHYSFVATPEVAIADAAPIPRATAAGRRRR